jgi:DNA polymerase III delta subunit
MRYTNLKAFEKHLAASSPDHLATLYLILSTDDYERKCAFDAVLSVLRAEPIRFPPSVEAKTLIDTLCTPSLFGGETVAIVDEAPAKLVERMAEWCDTEAPPGALLFGAKTKVPSQLVEKQGAILDMLEEKPWDKEKRWTEMLYEMAKRSGKRLLPDAAAWMIEHLEQSTALMAQEMDKILCYTADRALIEKRDVEAICMKSRTFSQWQIAEELVWEKTARRSFDAEASLFHALLASVRSQLAIGAKMHALHAGGVPYQEWGSYFPKIWPRALEKKAQAASRLGAAYFNQGLNLLFEIELLAKGSAVPQEALYDLLLIRLSHAKL